MTSCPRNFKTLPILGLAKPITSTLFSKECPIPSHLKFEPKMTRSILKVGEFRKKYCCQLNCFLTIHENPISRSQIPPHSGRFGQTEAKGENAI